MAAMADFVVATGLPPSAYWDSSRAETNAIVKALKRKIQKQNEANKRRR